ncbi:MAG: hypothetical protein MZV63_17190 [Marinilabiliales bacterium]|nr:hypothetical protein [Marinilabiliales bacterium]
MKHGKICSVLEIMPMLLLVLISHLLSLFSGEGVSYIPMIVNESNQWFTNEFSETGFTKDAPGDCEPMSDKGSWDSHVRVIENSDARVVVSWRYRLTEPGHHWANYNDTPGWGDVAEWDYYIYPDGCGCQGNALLLLKARYMVRMG